MLSEYITHNNRQTIGRYAYRVWVSIREPPYFGPDISGTPSQETKLVEEPEDATTYDPAMFPSWENALIAARATALLEGGRGIELLTHARNVMNAAYDWAIRNLEAKTHSTPGWLSTHWLTMKCNEQQCSLWRQQWWTQEFQQPKG